MIEAAGACEGPPLVELVARYPSRLGAPKLRALLGTPQPMTRSDLEAAFLERFAAAGLPRPDVNSVVEGFEVDFAWPERGVIAELDTYATHGSRYAFEHDRFRDRKLAAADWRVVRLTERAPGEAVDDLSRLLAASAGRSPNRRAAA